MPPSACVYYCVPPVRISRNGETSQAPVAEWYTRQVEGLCQKWRGGSSPLGGTAITMMTCWSKLLSTSCRF